ncbi:MAG: ribosomal subunit interface protein [Elusimicrobia bacterium RIFOXYD2_FULL_34_15]|nr:MAG: ribosomal subunit interface protein [Elusimicrobia bacterium RIFOXYD2_FULL_34_15]
MVINIRTIKVKVPNSLLDYINEKLAKSHKIFPNINEIEVFLSREKYLYFVEIVINLLGVTLKVKKKSTDFHSAVDMAVDKVELQLLKEKEKIKGHRKAEKYLLLEEKSFQSPAESVDLKKRKFIPEILSVNEALESLTENDYAFLVFTNSQNNKLSVIHKKYDSGYGLIEIEKRRSS